MSFHEEQDDDKAFHYAWILLLISLVPCRLPEDNQFHPQDDDLLEAMEFSSLWAMKDPERVMETKVF